jgi:3,4-dihydroxy 2-butanone 4-phosphate synthase/GTP cyclohydrolase II
VRGLADFGLTVTGTVPLPVVPTAENMRYLRAKRDRMGHLIELAADAPPGLDALPPGLDALPPGLDARPPAARPGRPPVAGSR